MLMPVLSVVLTFSVLFTFTDFQLVYAITRGGPVNSTHLMATLAFQRGIPGGQLGEGAAIAVAMIPFLVAATLISYFGLARRKWQQGESKAPPCSLSVRERAGVREAARAVPGLGHSWSLAWKGLRCLASLTPALSRRERGKASVP